MTFTGNTTYDPLTYYMAYLFIAFITYGFCSITRIESPERQGRVYCQSTTISPEARRRCLAHSSSSANNCWMVKWIIIENNYRKTILEHKERTMTAFYISELGQNDFSWMFLVLSRSKFTVGSEGTETSESAQRKQERHTLQLLQLTALREFLDLRTKREDPRRTWWTLWVEESELKSGRARPWEFMRQNTGEEKHHTEIQRFIEISPWVLSACMENYIRPRKNPSAPSTHIGQK